MQRSEIRVSLAINNQHQTKKRKIRIRCA